MMTFDLAVFEAIFGLSGRSRLFDMAGIFFAEWMPYIFCIILLIFIWKAEYARARLYWITLSLLSLLIARGVITEVVRFFYPRLRPYLELGIEPLIAHASASFPSGHAVAYSILATVILLMNRKAGIWMWVGVCVMGLARIFVGVHWMSDIIAGFGIGILSVVCVRFLIGKFFIQSGDASSASEPNVFEDKESFPTPTIS